MPTKKQVTMDQVKQTLRSDKYKAAFALYFDDKGYDRFYNDVMNAFTTSRNAEQLKDAMGNDTGEASVFYALTYAAQTGLSLNPAMKQARLATYWNKSAGCYVCSLEVDKDGLIKLANDAGCTIVSDVVKENDFWKMARKSNGDEYEFKPARKNRGEIDGFFCAITQPSGVTHVKYMEVSEIKEHRDRYGNRDKDGNISRTWKDEKDGGSFIGMAIKTVIKAAINSVKIGDAQIMSDEPAPVETLADEVRQENEPKEEGGDSNQAARF